MTRKRKFVTEMRLPPGHIGRKAQERPPRGTVKREPKLETIEFHDGADRISFMRRVELEVEDLLRGTAEAPQPMPAPVTLDVHTACWETPRQGETVDFRYVWDAEVQVLRYDHRPNQPPAWLLEGLWARHVAVDEGLLDQVMDAPLGAPRATPLAMPKTGDRSFVNAAGQVSEAGLAIQKVADRLAAMQARQMATLDVTMLKAVTQLSKAAASGAFKPRKKGGG